MHTYLKYCKNCVMPETKPDLVMDEEGVCNACRSFQEREAIDWDARRQELDKVLEQYRSKDQKNYDCIVPVRGGKESHYQTIRLLELGMNPHMLDVLQQGKVSAVAAASIYHFTEQTPLEAKLF